MWNVIKDWAKFLGLIALIVGLVGLAIFFEYRRVSACTTYLHLSTFECMMQGDHK